MIEIPVVLFWLMCFCTGYALSDIIREILS